MMMTTKLTAPAKSGGSLGPAKKLVIKPLKVKPELPSNFEEVTWAKLQDAVNAVHCKRPVSCSLEELYAAVQDMCMHKMADKLYGRLQQECDSHIGSTLAGLLDSLQLDAVQFLDRVDAVWRGHCEQMLTIRHIFLYLDRTYVITSAAVRSLFDMGLQLFRKHLASHPQVESQAVSGLLRLIERERSGEAVDRPLLKSLLRMFSSLNTYADAFQRPFLERTSQWYRAEGVRLMAELDVPAYLQHCETRLSEEYERCQQYLDVTTRKPLVLAVERELIQRHVAAVLEKGFTQLMDADRVEDLARLYVLAMRVSALDAVKGAFKDYIKLFGTKIVKDEEKDKDMVELLLEFKGRVERVLEAAFLRNEGFANALKEAFENFINTRQSKPAELVAKFIDAKLRSGNKGVQDDDLEAVLDKALMLFRYIQGKDVFEAFYKKDLAKRLLLGKSASIDSEKSMISKLKAECGSQFTNKLEGMFKDVDLSADVMTAFRQSSSQREAAAAAAAAKAGTTIEMSVSVLTSGFWPTYPIMEAKLPQELASYQEGFMGHYLAKYSGRRLAWHNSLGTCVLKSHFPKGVKELSVSLFQTVVLMLFNDADNLSFADIKEQTGIDDKELRRTLQSLACGKVRVLVKDPKGREVGDADRFVYNVDFSERLFRIKINTIQMKETEEENKKTNDQVLQDRQYQIDAALVRIMKTRKSLSHKLLVQEALVMLKFPLKSTDLKKRIESLIEREYMQRDATDANVYMYMA